MCNESRYIRHDVGSNAGCVSPKLSGLSKLVAIKFEHVSLIQQSVIMRDLDRENPNHHVSQDAISATFSFVEYGGLEACET